MNVACNPVDGVGPVAAEDVGIPWKSVEISSEPEAILRRSFWGQLLAVSQALGFVESQSYDLVKSVGRYGEMLKRNAAATVVENHMAASTAL